jgi:hypothetical protein
MQRNEPVDENISALIESEEIARNPNRKHYNSLQEVIDEIDNEPDDDI